MSQRLRLTAASAWSLASGLWPGPPAPLVVLPLELECSRRVSRAAFLLVALAVVSLVVAAVMA
jgi:hypothetical protein